MHAYASSVARKARASVVAELLYCNARKVLKALHDSNSTLSRNKHQICDHALRDALQGGIYIM